MADGENYILEIQSAKSTDSGIYTLAAANRVGKITCKVDIIVQGITNINCYYLMIKNYNSIKL